MCGRLLRPAQRTTTYRDAMRVRTLAVSYETLALPADGAHAGLAVSSPFEGYARHRGYGVDTACP